MLVERIKELAICNSTNIAEIERTIGFGKATIAKWNSSSPSAEKLYRVANFLSVPMEYLLTGELDKEKNNINIPYIKVTDDNVIEAFKKLSDSHRERILERIETFLELEEDKNTSKADLKAVSSDYQIKDICEYIVEEDKAKYETEVWGNISAGEGVETIVAREAIDAPVACDFALKVYGDSMEPTFKNNQIIYLKQQPDVENGQIAAVQIETDFLPTAYLKKVHKEGKNIRLESINKKYEDKIFSSNLVKILGIVIQ